MEYDIMETTTKCNCSKGHYFPDRCVCLLSRRLESLLKRGYLTMKQALTVFLTKEDATNFITDVVAYGTDPLILNISKEGGHKVILTGSMPDVVEASKEMVSDIWDLKEGCKQMINDIDDLQQAVKENIGNISTLYNNVKELREAVKENISSISSLQDSIKEIQEAVVQNISDILNLQDTVKSHTTDIQTLYHNDTEMEQDIQDSKNSISDNSGQIVTLNQAVTQLISDVSELQQAVKELING